MVELSFGYSRMFVLQSLYMVCFDCLYFGVRHQVVDPLFLSSFSSDNTLNKFRISKEMFIRMKNPTPVTKTNPTIMPRSGFELTTSHNP